MYEESFAGETAQAFVYERTGNSAVIWRCFSHGTKVQIPQQIGDCPVRAIAPYAFSAHMEERTLRRGLENGNLHLYVPEVLGGSAHWIAGGSGIRACKKETSAQSPKGQQADREQTGIREIPALCGDALEEVVFPGTLQRVGRYCFYDCARLHSLTFYGQTTDWGSGVFTRCHRVRNLCVHTDMEGRSSLKEVLDELPEEIFVEYYVPDECSGLTYARAQLVFPEFYEEGVENTPARILETHVHGSGMSYRNCFQGRRFDFGQYDALFSRAQVLEREQIVYRMVVGRLRTAVALSEKARSVYETYLCTHGKRIAQELLKQGDTQEFCWLIERLRGIGVSEWESLVQELGREAAGLHAGEAVSYLMNLGAGMPRKTKRRRLEL